MKSFKYRNLIVLCSIFIISSCSSMDGLRFWKSDEIDPDEPKELVAFSNQKNIGEKNNKIPITIRTSTIESTTSIVV